MKGAVEADATVAALRNRGVQINKACVAVARELAGFVWAMGLQAQREEARVV